MNPGKIFQRLKANKILLCGILFLSVFCLPAYSGDSLTKPQQGTQTEVLFPGLLTVKKPLLYKGDLFLHGSFQGSKSLTTDYVRLLRYYDVLLKTRMNCLAAQSRSLRHCSNIYPPKFIPQHPDEEFFPACRG